MENNDTKKKSNTFLLDFVNKEPQTLKQRLIDYFENKKIFVEIYNGNINLSDSYAEKLKLYKAKIYKTLTKNLEYILFDNGHLKTKRFGALNNIPIVNPLWLDDKITYGIFKNDSEYLVKPNYVEFRLDITEDDEDDDPDTSFRSYIDSKIKSIENNSNYKVKQNLYNSNTKVSFRQKRTSFNIFNKNNNNKISNNSIINNSKKNNLLNKVNNSDKQKKLKKFNSLNNLNKQLCIDVSSGKLCFDKIINNKPNNKNKKISKLSIDIFNNNDKINLYSFFLENEKVVLLSNLYYFDYKKNIFDIPPDFDKNKDVLVVDYEADKYNYKIYNFILEKIILVDVMQFSLEFMDEKFLNSPEQNKKAIIKKLNAVLLTNDFCILNSKLSTKQFTLDDFKNVFFIINKNIELKEYNILKIILKKYLNANLFENYNDEFKSSFRTPKIKTLSNSSNINGNNDSNELKNEKIIYLITKFKSSIIYNINKNCKYHYIIKSTYVFDSFKKGYLINLKDKTNLYKYGI